MATPQATLVHRKIITAILKGCSTRQEIAHALKSKELGHHRRKCLNELVERGYVTQQLEIVPGTRNVVRYRYQPTKKLIERHTQ